MILVSLFMLSCGDILSYLLVLLLLLLSWYLAFAMLCCPTGGLDNANRLPERPRIDPPACGCPKRQQEDSQTMPTEGSRCQQMQQQRTGRLTMR